MAQKHFLSLFDWSREEIELLFELAATTKASPESYASTLAGQSLAMIFQKASTRTRVSFEVGMHQLGGHALFLSAADIQLHRGETIADTARVLSRMVNGIMARVFAHQDLLDLAGYGSVPVINGLSDLLHPCQALADYFTLREQRGELAGLKMAYVGDGNNVAHSLMFAGALLGAHVVVVTPPGYEPKGDAIEWATRQAEETGGSCTITNDPVGGVRGADVIYTAAGYSGTGAIREAKKAPGRYIRPITATNNFIHA